MDPKFNPFLESVVLRINEARDLGEKDRFEFYDHTKTWMASPPETLWVADKNVKAHPVLNCTGIIISTNHKTDGLYLLAEDRRHFVTWIDLTPEDFEPGYWPRIYNWYVNEGGYGHVAAHLATLDIKDFNPQEPPPKTPAFWEIVNANRPPEDSELADVLDEIGDPFGMGEWPHVVTVEDLVRGAQAVDHRFAEWISDRKNRRNITHRLEKCSYSPLRNPDDKHDGQWKINGRRVTVYARSNVAIADRFKAVQAYKEAAERRRKPETDSEER